MIVARQLDASSTKHQRLTESSERFMRELFLARLPQGSRVYLYSESFVPFNVDLVVSLANKCARGLTRD